MNTWFCIILALSCFYLQASEKQAHSYYNAEADCTLLTYTPALDKIVTTTADHKSIMLHTESGRHTLSPGLRTTQAMFLHEESLLVCGTDNQDRCRIYQLDQEGSWNDITPLQAPRWFRLLPAQGEEPAPAFLIQGGEHPQADAALYRITLQQELSRIELFHEAEAGVVSHVLDRNSTPAASLRWNPDGSKTLRIHTTDGQARDALHLPTENRLQLVGSASNGNIYLVHDYRQEFAVLAEYTPATGELQNISNAETAEIGNLIFRADGVLLGYCTMREKLQYHPLRPCGLVSDFLRGLPQESSARMVAVSDDESKLLAWVSENSGPFRLMMYTAGKGCVPLEKSAAPVPPTRPTQFAEYPAADGTRIPVYYTLPDGKGPFPTVIFVHGGPRMRTDDSYDWRVQYLVSQGFAVVQPQFRGSRGWGSSFMHAGNRQWGKGCIQTDVNDAIPWLIRQGIAQPNKIAIFGGSYGGYAVTAALAFTPGLYTCGISLFGPQDLMLHLQKMNGMDAPFAGEDSLTIGDISTAEGRAHLRSISPVYHADNFQEPLLLYYGGKDTLIPPEHSQRLYKALRAAGKDVTLVTYPDEAHGFADPAHEPQLYARHIIPFLNKHLNKHPHP